MALEVNRHVERMTGYLPFDADTSLLFHEYVEPNNDVLNTGAFKYIVSVLERPGCQLVVLTGDAGHGKTHLCYQLLVELGMSRDEAQLAIRTRSDGSTDISQTKSGRSVRIVKDLSEFTSDADALLTAAMTAGDRVTVVCANEGRLRRAIQEGPPGLELIRQTLEDGSTSGRTTLDGATYVVNLNFQSIAMAGGKSLTSQLLRIWAQDQRKWRTCATCDARDVCPIFENHRLLGTSPESEARRDRLAVLMRQVERAGTVATIRELLIVASLAITGGMRCEDVHRKWERGKENRSWQHQHLFHQAIFGSTLSHRDVKRVRLLGGLGQLDPGSVALRPVDDFLVPSDNSEQGNFLPPLPSIDEPTARTRAQFRRDAARQRQLIAFLRRRSLFNEASYEGSDVGERVGLKYARLFDQVVAGTIDEAGRVGLRDRLIAGLEAIQGVRRQPQATFLVVDPAFTSHRSSASVVARQLPGSSITFMSQREWWIAQSEGSAELASALDWSDRSVIVEFDTEAGHRPLQIQLDLLRFELVLRYADGLTARDHFHADLRRLSSRLAKLATATDSSEVTVLVRGERKKLSIDVGNRIRALDG